MCCFNLYQIVSIDNVFVAEGFPGSGASCGHVSSAGSGAEIGAETPERSLPQGRTGREFAIELVQNELDETKFVAGGKLLDEREKLLKLVGCHSGRRRDDFGSDKIKFGNTKVGFSRPNDYTVKDIMWTCNPSAGTIRDRLALWMAEGLQKARSGRLPTYVPQLAASDRHSWAVAVRGTGGLAIEIGASPLAFSLMSSVKPLLLFYLLCEFGERAVFTCVGCEPSPQPYNSLAQLREDGGFPRNPMLNSGAIALAEMLPGASATERCDRLRRFLNELAGGHFFLDKDILASVRSLPNRSNRDLAALLAASGNLKDADTAIDTYNQICCLAGTVVDLAGVGAFLARPHGGSSDAAASATVRVAARATKALMLTCGLYEASAAFAVRAGIPTKSGISGVLLSVLPDRGSLVCYSPPLDERGNSIAGLYLVEKVARELRSGVFD